MTATPVVSWSSVAVPPTAAINVPYYRNLNPGDPLPPVTLQHVVQRLQCTVAVSGDAPVSFTGNIAEGSDEIYNASSYTGLFAGMSIVSACLQNGCTIIEVDSGIDIILSGKALTSGTPATFTATDSAPNGYLTASVSPSSGVTMSDSNFDGQPADSTTNTGALNMSNFSNQAEAIFDVVFANPGSYTVSCAFTTRDSSFQNGVVPQPLLVTVT